jgi:hypothetical protein
VTPCRDFRILIALGFADAQAYDPQARQRLKRLSFELTACPFRKLAERR